MHQVFVYGTLRQGQSNHALLEGSEYLGSFITHAQFDLYDLGHYPAAIEGSRILVGEVYRVDESTMQQLDQLEDYPIEYDRKLIATPYGQAWVYVYQQRTKLTCLIADGDWCRYHSQ